MRRNKSPQQLKMMGAAFVAIGLSLLVIGMSGTRSFLAVGVVFMALGGSFLARSRR